MKTSNKLLASVALMVISLTLMVSVTFAWFTLSDSPAVTGIKISIGGDNTILIANDKIVEDANGNKVSVPGYFSKNADLEVAEGTLLSPVSTADGVNWFIPTVTESGEMDVSDLNKFTLDKEFTYANTEDGGYAYVDFWIVSPMDSTFLRISSGDQSGEEIGSYVIELPQSVKDKSKPSGFTLNEVNDALASSVRVGFLVDDATITDSNVMNTYMSSHAFREEMKALKGNYNVNSEYDFLIYEPNGLSHPQKGVSTVLTPDGLKTANPQEGEYWITHPIGLGDENNPEFANIPDKLIVQTENLWKKNRDTNSIILEDMYQAYLNQRSAISLSDFYENYLHENYLQYVVPGRFFESTWDLYLNGDLTKTDSEQLSVMTQTNAVSESYITILEKNVPQKIRMFVWIEGQDVDCSYYAASQTISLRLEFAGSTGA